MKHEKLIRAIGTLDDNLILRAGKYNLDRSDRTEPNVDTDRGQNRGNARESVTDGDRFRFPKSLRLAACVAAMAILGVGVCAAAGLLPGSIFKHFSSDGDLNLYQERILTAIATASSEDLEFRLDGAVTDSRQCLVVLSTKALSPKGEEFLKDDIHPLKIKAVLKNGTAIDLQDWSYSYHAGSRTAAEASYLLEIRPTDFDVPQIETLSFQFEDLSLKVEMQHHLTDTVILQSENAGALSIVEMSPLGIYMEIPVTDSDPETILEQQSNMKIRLILADGTFTDDYSLEGTVTHDTVQNKLHVYENFVVIDEHTLKIAMVDLNNFSGLQVNGINYLIPESLPEG